MGRKVKASQYPASSKRFGLLDLGSLRLFVSVLILFFSASSAAGETDPPRLRARATGSPGEPVWIGQKVPFYVTLSLSGRPKGSPQFIIPEVSGGILLHIPGRPVYGSEEKDGIAYTTWAYSFAFYPHRTHAHTIPPITIRANLPEGDGTWLQLEASTRAFQVTAKLPTGAEGLATLVSTTKMEAVEKWNPNQTTVHVGDAITRTISLRAPDVLGMGFPPLRFEPVEGVAIYPKSPQIQDKTYRGDIVGERIETVVYVCEREGDITLPGLVIPWFDLKAKALKQIRFPEHSIRVAPNPAFTNISEEIRKKDIQPKRHFSWRGWIILLAVVAALSIAAHRYFHRIRAWRNNRKILIKTSEAFLFKKLTTDAKANDPQAVVNQAARWLQSLRSKLDVCTLTVFADEYGNRTFQDSVAALMRRCFGPDASPKTVKTWHDPNFLKGLTDARSRCLHIEHPGYRQLSPMNPPPKTTVLKGWQRS